MVQCQFGRHCNNSSNCLRVHVFFFCGESTHRIYSPNNRPKMQCLRAPIRFAQRYAPRNENFLSKWNLGVRPHLLYIHICEHKPIKHTRDIPVQNC